MQFYIRQGADADALFTIMDSSGQPVYRVVGEFTPIGGKFSLTDREGGEIARVFSVGLTTVSKYSVVAEEKERARVTCNLKSKSQPVKIKGVSWRFRGDLISRSYDLVNVDSSVIMTHGRCWNSVGDCYAVEIHNEADVPVCLCIAAILDSTVLGGMTAPVPAN